ncbi:MAG: DUF4330 domain-containing protein [Oscillospiraceae bacterium]|nr:DUF4330 domain-containing protein [Oscillospiraceae bacterium]
MTGKNVKDIKEVKDRGGRKAGFNIIDILIVLFIILAAVGIVMRYNLADKVNLNANGDKFEVEFLIENIQKASEDYLTAGTPFYINTDSTQIGEIKEILDVRDAVQYVPDVDGNIIKSELPGRIDVTGMITCSGRTTKDGYMINGNSFAAPGKQYTVHTGKLTVTITIMSITKVN